MSCGLILLVALLVLSSWARPMGEESAPLSNMTRKALSEGDAAGYKNGTVRASNVSVSYSLAKDQFTLHEPVILEFTVRNGFAGPVKLGIGEGDLLFAVTRPDRSSVKVPQLRREGIAGWGIPSLQAGQTYAHDLVLNEWLDFPTPGRYEIVAQLDKSLSTRSGITISDTEFHGYFEITPRDAEQLGRVCQELLAHIAGVGNVEEALNAAHILSNIKDPVAVPYLGKALSTNRMVDSVVVPALTRIGGEDAANVLISALKTQPRQTARELIRPALMRISANSSDAALKERIKQALSKG